MADTLEYRDVAFPRARFDAELLEELRSRSLLEIGDATATATTLVIQPRLHRAAHDPAQHLPAGASSAAPASRCEHARASNTATRSRTWWRANIFPGDLLLKNFGVTRHGRVVFYDYDEIDTSPTATSARCRSRATRKTRCRARSGTRSARTTCSRRPSALPARQPGRARGLHEAPRRPAGPGVLAGAQAAHPRRPRVRRVSRTSATSASCAGSRRMPRRGGGGMNRVARSSAALVLALPALAFAQAAEVVDLPTRARRHRAPAGAADRNARRPSRCCSPAARPGRHRRQRLHRATTATSWCARAHLFAAAGHRGGRRRLAQRPREPAFLGGISATAAEHAADLGAVVAWARETLRQAGVADRHQPRHAVRGQCGDCSCAARRRPTASCSPRPSWAASRFGDSRRAPGHRAGPDRAASVPVLVVHHAAGSPARVCPPARLPELMAKLPARAARAPDRRPAATRAAARARPSPTTASTASRTRSSGDIGAWIRSTHEPPGRPNANPSARSAEVRPLTEAWRDQWELASFVVTTLGLPFAILFFAWEQRKERDNEEEEPYQLLSNAYNDFLRVVLAHPDLHLRTNEPLVEPVGRAARTHAGHLRHARSRCSNAPTSWRTSPA